MPRRARGLAQPGGNRPRIRLVEPGKKIASVKTRGPIRQEGNMTAAGKDRNGKAWTAAVAGGRAFPCAPDDLKEENP